MTSVSITFPKYRLAKQLRQPGGRSVAEALREAEAGLETLVPECLKALDDILERVDLRWRGFLAKPGLTTAQDLYFEVNKIVGVANTARLVEMDRAAYSLCDLIDHMCLTGRWECDAATVHVQALHLLRQPAALGADSSVRHVLLGLKKVREKVFAGDVVTT